MIRTLLIASFALSTVAFSATPAFAKNARDKAVAACKERTVAELGEGKVNKIRSKRKRSGYNVSFIKFDAEGNKLGKVTCTLKKGEVVEFASAATSAKAR